MFGLPERTEFNLKITKEKFYSHSEGITQKEKDMFVSDVEKIIWKHKLSEQTTNISADNDISEIEVIYLQLRNKDFNIKLLKLIKDTIPYSIVFALEYENEVCLAVYRGEKLFRTGWKASESFILILNGLNLKEVWENFIIQIGCIEVSDDKTLDEQIAEDEEKQKIKKQIEQLESKARKETNPRKKFEYARQLQELKVKLKE